MSLRPGAEAQLGQVTFPWGLPLLLGGVVHWGGTVGGGHVGIGLNTPTAVKMASSTPLAFPKSQPSHLESEPSGTEPLC